MFQAAIGLYLRSVQSSLPTQEEVTTPDGLPPGWQKIESRSRKGEFSYLNLASGKRQAVRPTEAVPGYAAPVKLTLASTASSEQVRAHLEFAKFCDQSLQRGDSDKTQLGVDVAHLSSLLLQSHLTAMKCASMCVSRMRRLLIALVLSQAWIRRGARAISAPTASSRQSNRRHIRPT